MNIKLAEKIMHDFGKFLEISHGILMMIFFCEIPESLLPYPREQIENALKSMKNYFQDNTEAVKHIDSALAMLLFYTKDEDALNSFLKRIQNKKSVEKIIELWKKRQKELLQELEKNYKNQ